MFAGKHRYVYDRTVGKIVPIQTEKRRAGGKRGIGFAAQMWIILAAALLLTTVTNSAEDESAATRQRAYVYVCGDVIGISSNIDGVRISKDSKSASVAGLVKDDVIIAVNSSEVKASVDVARIAQDSDGEMLDIMFQRSGELLETAVRPVYSIIERCYKCRLTLSETKPFLGTLTYITDDGRFSAVAHKITSASIAQAFDTGTLYCSNITGIKKSSGSSIGTLNGVIDYSRMLGIIEDNGGNGIVGAFDGDAEEFGTRYPVAFSNEIAGGEATLIAFDGEGGKTLYTAEIANVNIGSGTFDIIITDRDFLDKFGGYAFGMSGSPVIQNDMFIGAITGVKKNHLDCGQGRIASSLLGIE